MKALAGLPDPPQGIRLSDIRPISDMRALAGLPDPPRCVFLPFIRYGGDKDRSPRLSGHLGAFSCQVSGTAMARSYPEVLPALLGGPDPIIAFRALGILGWQITVPRIVWAT